MLRVLALPTHVSPRVNTNHFALVLLVAALGSCGRTAASPPPPTPERVPMSHAESNQPFMQKLFSEKKKLDDFPDRVAPDVVVYEPTSLPFGGTDDGAHK
jgi:hypothetical protein